MKLPSKTTKSLRPSNPVLVQTVLCALGLMLVAYYGTTLKLHWGMMLMIWGLTTVCGAWIYGKTSLRQMVVLGLYMVICIILDNIFQLNPLRTTIILGAMLFLLAIHDKSALDSIKR